MQAGGSQQNTSVIMKPAKVKKHFRRTTEHYGFRISTTVKNTCINAYPEKQTITQTPQLTCEHKVRKRFDTKVDFKMTRMAHQSVSTNPAKLSTVCGKNYDRRGERKRSMGEKSHENIGL